MATQSVRCHSVQVQSDLEGKYNTQHLHDMKQCICYIYTQNERGGVLLLVKHFLNPLIYTEADVDAEIVWVTLNPHPNLSCWVGGGMLQTRDR